MVKCEMKALACPASLGIGPYESYVAEGIYCYPVKYCSPNHGEFVEEIKNIVEHEYTQCSLDGRMICKNLKNNTVTLLSEDGARVIYELDGLNTFKDINFYGKYFIYKKAKERVRKRRIIFRNMENGKETVIETNVDIFQSQFKWDNVVLCLVSSRSDDSGFSYIGFDLESLSVVWEIPEISYKNPILLRRPNISAGKLSSYQAVFILVGTLKSGESSVLDLVDPASGSIIARYELDSIVDKILVNEWLVVTTLRGWNVINLSNLEIQSYPVEWETDIATRPLIIDDRLYLLTTRYSVNRRVFILVYNWKTGHRVAHVELPGLVFFGSTQLFQYGDYLAANFKPDVAHSEFDPYYNYLMLVTPEELLSDGFSIELENVEQFTEIAVQEGDERHYRIAVDAPEGFFHFFRFMDIGVNKCANVRSLSKLDDEKPYDPDFNGLIIMDCTNIDLNDKEMDAMKFDANRIEEECKRLDKVDAVRRKPIRVVCEFKE